MKKNILAILVSITILMSFSSSVFAKDGEKELMLNFTIEDVLNKVEKDNLEINILNNKIKLLNKLYDRDRVRASEVKDSDRTDLESKKAQYLNYKQTGQQVESTKHERESRLKQIKNDLERQCLNLINCDKEIEMTNKSMENIDEEIKKANANIKQGRMVSNTIESLNIKRAQLVGPLNRSKLQREESMIKIKQYLNIDKNTNINLLGFKRNFEKFYDKNIEDLIDRAITKNYDLYIKNQDLEFTKEEKWVYSNYGINTIQEELNLEIRVKDLENDLQNTKSNVEINLWRAYYDLKAKESTAEIEMLNLENAKSRYNESEIRYKAGAIDKLQLQSSKLELDKQNVTTERAINDYMITVDFFKDSLAGF